VLYPFETLFLLRVKLLGFFSHARHVHFAQMLRLVEIFVEGVWRVDRVVCRGRIFAGILQDDVEAAGVLWGEFGDIVGLDC
jgi:hypothetical protein